MPAGSRRYEMGAAVLRPYKGKEDRQECLSRKEGHDISCPYRAKKNTPRVAA